MLSADELRQYSFFAQLSDSALEQLAGRVESMEALAGTRIIRQGSPPDYFYFVNKGELEVTKRNQFGQNAKLRVLCSGETFGEMALLTCSHRTCSVTAKTDSTLYRLSKKHFEEAVLMDAAMKDMFSGRSATYAEYTRIKSFQPLALLAPEKMLSLVDRFTEQKYRPGEDIIKQGDPPGSYYIIKSGKVAVLKGKPGMDPKQVDVISEGGSFGEEAIIREENRKATVRAIEDTVVLALDKKDFNKLLKSSFLEYTFPEEVTMEEIGRFVFIDARVPPEYEEEHIEGAVNIPIEELRKKYSELDPEQEYLTYCTNDSRGMTAAFLMGINGFKARCLRGGLSGWEGPVSQCSDGIHLPSSK